MGEIKTRFIIGGMPRSGTTLLHKYISIHPKITTLSAEIFIRPLFNLGVETFTQGNWISTEEREKSYQGIFDVISGLVVKDRPIVSGIKTTFSSLNDVQLLLESGRKNIENIKF